MSKASRSAAKVVSDMSPKIDLAVHISFDDDAKTWYIAESDLPGLRVEANSAHELVRKIEDVAPDLIELNAAEIFALHGAAQEERKSKRPLVHVRVIFDSPMAIAC